MHLTLVTFPLCFLYLTSELTQNALLASAWNGFDADAGTASLHSFNEIDADEAEPGMGLSVDEKLAPAEFSF